MFHATFAGMKNFMDDGLLAGFLGDSIISQEPFSYLNFESLIGILLAKSPSGFCPLINGECCDNTCLYADVHRFL